METVGIDFGGTSVKMGVCRGASIVERRPPIPTAEYDTAEALIERLAADIRETRRLHPGLGALGVGVPGFVAWEAGTVHGLTNVPGWEGIALRDRLEGACGLPAVVDNDANCMTYAEWRLGAGRGSDHLLALTLGTGVGAGLVLDGRLYRGSTSMAGELGQVSIDYRGRPSPYGNLGALERYIGNRQIARRAAKLYEKAGIERGPESCTPRRLAEAAEAGDALARRIWNEVARELATALAAVVWLLNPDRIVVGGGIANAGEVLFGPLRHHLEHQLDPAFRDPLEVVPAAFGNDAGILGSAMMAADEAGDRRLTADPGAR